MLALGGVLSSLIFTNGHSISNAIGSLVEDNLPHLNAISKLRAAIFVQKPLLYEYYASTEREIFPRSCEPNPRAIEARLHTIHTVSEGNVLRQEINTCNDKINLSARQLV